MRDVIKQLTRLKPKALHKEAVGARRSQAEADHYLAACLLAAERTGLARKRGHSSAVEYGAFELELDREKAVDLLRAARLLEGLPLISEAFREGKLGWRKIRVLTRVACPKTEEQWLQAALSSSPEDLSRQVALTPTEWKRRAQAATAAAALTLPFEEGGQGPSAPEASAHAGALGVDADGDSAPAKTSAEEMAASAGTTAAQGTVGAGAPAAAPAASGTAPKSGPLPLPGPKRIRVTLLFTPEEYATYEKAQQRVSNKRRRRVSREEATVAMAEQLLAEAPARSRARHQVVIHVDAATEQAWLQTDRGVFTLPDERRDQVLVEADVHYDLAPGEGVQGALDLRTKSEQTGRVRPKLTPALPLATLRALFARAGGRCERCQGSQGLQVHHGTPRSRGGNHLLAGLALLCDGCHGVGHDPDYADDPSWRAGREAGRRRQERRKRAKSPGC